MQEPDTRMPTPKTKAPATSAMLTGPMCAPGGSRAGEGTGRNAPNTA